LKQQTAKGQKQDKQSSNSKESKSSAKSRENQAPVQLLPTTKSSVTPKTTLSQ
jgi:hypothetical protein